jgi:ferredoxin
MTAFIALLLVAADTFVAPSLPLAARRTALTAHIGVALAEPASGGSGQQHEDAAKGLSLDEKLDIIHTVGSQDAGPYLVEREQLIGTIDSSSLLARDEEEGLWPEDLSSDPAAVEMLFVDEMNCIGCKFCTTVARATFAMADGEEDYGTARVVQQGGDEEDTVQEAIDSCPADCIHRCTREDLGKLEEYRALYLNDVMAKWQTRRLVSQGAGAPHWRDPLVHTSWRHGARYVRSERLKMEKPLVRDDEHHEKKV